MTILFYLAILLQTRIISHIAITVPVAPAQGLTAVTHRSRLSFLGLSADTVTLTWSASPDASSPYFSGYSIWRAHAAAGGVFKEIEAPVAALEYVDTTVARRSTYRYYVVATAGKVAAKASNTVKVETP